MKTKLIPFKELKVGDIIFLRTKVAPEFIIKYMSRCPSATVEQIEEMYETLPDGERFLSGTHVSLDCGTIHYYPDEVTMMSIVVKKQRGGKSNAVSKSK